MPKYNYECNVCGKQYSETRLSTQEQWTTQCAVIGCTGTFVEVE